MQYNSVLKTCTKCREVKSIDEFGKDKLTNDGLKCWCRSCKAKDALRYSNTEGFKDKRRVYAKAYHETNREAISKYKTKRYPKVRAKRLEYGREHYKANREKVIKRTKAYSKANPEKTRIILQRYRSKKASLPATLTISQWQETLETFRHKCVYCGEGWKHQEHLVPVAKGGGYTKHNIVPSCAPCNHRKHSKNPIVFAGTNKIFDITHALGLH